MNSKLSADLILVDLAFWPRKVDQHVKPSLFLRRSEFHREWIKEQKQKHRKKTHFLPDIFESFNTFSNFFQTSFYFP